MQYLTTDFYDKTPPKHTQSSYSHQRFCLSQQLKTHISKAYEYFITILKMPVHF